MTRPDVFGLARAITEDAAQGDDYRDDCTCSRCEETRALCGTATFHLATALLALEPVWQAAQEWKRHDEDPTAEPGCGCLDKLADAITTARAALGRETT